MNTSINKTVLLFCIIIICAVASSFVPHQKKEVEKEVLFVEIYVSFGISAIDPAIYIHHNNKDIERHSLKASGSRKNLESNAEIIKSKFQELYADGWRIESASGGDLNQRYFLVR
ncbi:MAG: hypothetical protein ACK4ND_19105 [Cytophagaceae bacterium]